MCDEMGTETWKIKELSAMDAHNETPNSMNSTKEQHHTLDKRLGNSYIVFLKLILNTAV